jgi:hypothetical protein
MNHANLDAWTTANNADHGMRFHMRTLRKLRGQQFSRACDRFIETYAYHFLTRNDWEGKPIPDKNMLWFQLAAVLLQELTHAVRFLADDRNCEEAFANIPNLNDQSRAELGFYYVGEVFGSNPEPIGPSQCIPTHGLMWILRINVHESELRRILEGTVGGGFGVRADQ